ncbi:MAG: Unknown protein [uncultured Sulfurovum sp.]|uniref:Tyrosine-protein kinase Wzc (EC) n=1 Tax=uncultured Sulfurovum sp. TaxID=269237 RepID=A0A6S6T7K7_9BACT|nr:MAG: Unknown protein [uncultured Sulfurovum sp.]
MQTNNSTQYIEEDEIDLRELFATIGRYKWSIIFFTLLITFGVAIKVYFMPKYYQSTVTIEVKPQEDDTKGFSMGGAASMLLGGGGSSSNLEKDITLLKTYRINEKVLEKTQDYMVRYFITDEKHKEAEIDSNLSITVTDIKINNFKNYGMRLKVQPFSNTEYKLLTIGKFFDDTIGIYHYSEMVNHEDFTLMVHKQQTFNEPYTIELSGTKRYVFENIISKNLSIEADKDSPFITLSFLDNLPHRGEQYLQNLINIYTQQSINDLKEDASVVIDSYDAQIQKVEEEVKSSSNDLKNFKTEQNIVNPQLQAGALVEELSKVGIQIAQNEYKKELLTNLIRFTQNNQNIDAIASSLIELQDEPTISLIKVIQEKQLTLANLLLKYKADHPNIQAAHQTIYALKVKVLSNLKNLKKTLENKSISLKNMEKNYQKNLKSSPEKEQELISFSRDYQVNEKVYLYLMQERSAVKLKHDKALSRFKVVESIYTADRAVKPKKALIVVVAFITSFILMIFMAFFREFMRKNKGDK